MALLYDETKLAALIQTAIAQAQTAGVAIADDAGKDLAATIHQSILEVSNVIGGDLLSVQAMGDRLVGQIGALLDRVDATVGRLDGAKVTSELTLAPPKG